MSIALRVEKLHALRVQKKRTAEQRAASVSAVDRDARAAQLYAAGHSRVVQLFDLARERQHFADLA